MTLQEIFQKVWLNAFVVVGIIIILCMVWYDVTHVNAKLIKNTDECNKHWLSEVAMACPELLNPGGSDVKYELNLSQIIGEVK